MAKAFIYDSAGTVDAITVDGTTAGGTDFTAGVTIANEHYLNDNSIANAATTFDDNDAIQFDFTVPKSATKVAVYFNAQEESNIEIHASNEVEGGGVFDMGAADKTHSTTIEIGWTIIDLGGTVTGRYWYIVGDGALEGLCEVIIGTQYDFDSNPSLGNTLGENFGIDVVETYGGIEHSNKRHAGKTVWNWQWEYVSSSTKTSLETLRDAVDGDRLKFIYDDETTKNWVRMGADSLVFTETTYQAWSAPISLREQLS